MRRFVFESRGGADSRSHWDGAGAGVVELSSGADWLRYHERGNFTPNGGKAIAIHNRYLWERRADRLGLSHERRAEPVFLFELQADPEIGDWRTVQPHLCGRDTYRAHLGLCADGFTLEWRIQGSKKDEYLNYRYQF